MIITFTVRCVLWCASRHPLNIKRAYARHQLGMSETHAKPIFISTQIIINRTHLLLHSKQTIFYTVNKPSSTQLTNHHQLYIYVQ